ncbi:CPBP family intramembrane metalloprotease [Candidatus Saccharibacteria bacterium]|nr:CPBP family intramembrane metalloprotease [Candidatus Saccharibacteria bacterium]MBQ1540301.1 CPBP family intramembrane metalloprotease [Candidatus Saccharibacteria bacterium]
MGGKKKIAQFDWSVVGKVFLMCLWVAVSVIAVQFAIGFLMIWMLGVDRFTQPVWTAVYSAVSYVLAMALIIWVPPRVISRTSKKASSKKVVVKKTSREDLGLTGWPTWTDVGLGPVGFIASTLLAAGLIYIFTLFPWFNAEEVQDVGFSVYMSGGDRVIAFFTLVVVAPIAEEIIFRGWLYGKIRVTLHDKIPEQYNIVLSILIVSVLFGAVHLQWNVGVNVFALSVVACALREVTGTIYAGILAHMVKNGVAFYLLYVLGVG